MAQPGKALLNLLALASTRLTSTSPIRVTQTTATCIDIIAVNEDIKVNNTKVIITAASNHYPVTTVITFSHSDTVESIVKHSFNKVDFAEL